jgi:pyruvate kinase
MKRAKRAKIVCTIGPATSSAKVLAALMKAGMDVARLNFSHGTHREHSTYIRHIREQARRLKKPVAVLQDLQGIKIRIGEVEGRHALRILSGPAQRPQSRAQGTSGRRAYGA